MTTFKPFRALRPNPEVASQVAALPYDVYSSEESREVVKDQPLSFLNIDRAETQFEPGHDMYAQDVYEKADQMIWEWTEKGIFEEEDQPAYYIYELTMDGRCQTGIVGAASIDDYLNHVCKKHENTVPAKETDRINHVDVTSAHTGPIFLAYRDHDEIEAIVQEKKQEEPLYDFVSNDGIRHRVWIIDRGSIIQNLQEAFRQVPSTYIADGHHRNASAVKVGLKRRDQHPDHTGEEEFNYYLAICFPAKELKILDYNRYIKDLNGYTPKQFLQHCEEVFEITPLPHAQYPSEKGQMNMVLEGQWYACKVRKDILEKKQGPVETLDVAILQDELLKPVLGIDDPRTNDRIQFIGGIRGLEELERKVQTNGQGVAFAMHPTQIEELFAVADAGLLMPPKSTWFEPKPRSGLFIHRFER